MKNLRNKLKEKKGFTLIEMIIVIAIIAILIALIAPNMTKFLGTAKKTKGEAAAKTLYTAATAYVTDLSVAGETIPSEIKKDGTSATAGETTDREKFEASYLNEKELKSITTYTITIDPGTATVTSAECTISDTGTTPYKYPKAD